MICSVAESFAKNRHRVGAEDVYLRTGSSWFAVGLNSYLKTGIVLVQRMFT